MVVGQKNTQAQSAKADKELHFDIIIIHESLFVINPSGEIQRKVEDEKEPVRIMLQMCNSLSALAHCACEFDIPEQHSVLTLKPSFFMLCAYNGLVCGWKKDCSVNLRVIWPFGKQMSSA